MSKDFEIALALKEVLYSENESDCNGETANIVDVVANLARSTQAVANGIRSPSACMSHDETGGMVDSLTEAVMGVTKGLCRIADAIESVAGELSSRNIDAAVERLKD